MNKNDIVTLDITDITTEGAGVGKADGMAVFVPMTAVGDKITAKIVKVKPRYAYGILQKILAPSPYRTDNDCPYFNRCGGCVFRHISYEAELQIKANRVKETLKRIGGADVPSGGIIGADTPQRYRNKAQFPFGSDYETGFFAPRSHRVIPIKNCALLPDVFSGIADCVSAFLEKNNIPIYNEETGEGLLRHLYIRKGALSGEIMVVLVVNGTDLPYRDELCESLKNLLGENLKSIQINNNTKRNNVILGDKNTVIYGTPYINDILCGVKIRLSPFTFYQVNHDMAEKLYEKVSDYAEPCGKSVIDLYCGAGTIGLSLAKKAKRIIGVEIVPEAIEDAKINAKENSIANTEFICGDAATAAKTLADRKEKADVVILDPPRKGCDETLLNTVAKDFAPERIVYVSCDPGTLSRDIKTLCEKGYKPMEYTVFDMFPRTAHVECVTLMTRKETN